MSTLLKRRSVITRLIQIANHKPNTAVKCGSSLTQKLPQASILSAFKPNLEICRSKSKSSKKKQAAAESGEDESDEEGPDFENLIIDKNTKIVTTKVNSLRADVILKNGLSMPRNKVEEMFYQSKIRINGKKIFKKSDPVQEGDEVDIIKDVNVNNPKFLTVARVEILSIAPKSEHYSVKVRRCKNLTIENYEEAWKPETGE